MAGAPHASRLPERTAPGSSAVPWGGRLARFVPAALQPQADDVDRSTKERSRRTWVADIAVTVVAIAFAAVLHIDETNHRQAAEWLHVVDWVALPIGVVALFWRRERPLTVAVLLAALSCVSLNVGFASMVAAYAVAAYSRPNIAAVGIGALLVPLPVMAVLWPNASGDSNFWSDVTFGLVITLGVGAWGLFAGARRQLVASLRDRATRAESEQQLRVEQARQQERTRIAREMHDVLAHRMSLLSVHAGALEFRPDAPAEEVARAAGVIRATAHEALEELRTVIGVLRVSESVRPDAGSGDDVAADSAPEPPQPTLTAVPHLVDEWRQAGARIALELDPRASDVPPTIGRAAYRIVQEALTNAGKHAPTARVEVVVQGEPGASLTVSVTNPLALSGAPTQIPGTGIGLIGLRERTELVGGAFAAGVDPELRRFVLEARLPWSAA